MSKAKPSLNYSQVDWTGFESIPDEEVFNDWRDERKRKHGTGVTQSAMNRIRPHINKLARDGIEADTAFEIAASHGWRGIKYAWVIKDINDDMDDYSGLKPTRDMTLLDESSHSWANPQYRIDGK